MKVVFSHGPISLGDKGVAFQITHIARVDYLHTLFASE